MIHHFEDTDGGGERVLDSRVQRAQAPDRHEQQSQTEQHHREVPWVEIAARDVQAGHVEKRGAHAGADQLHDRRRQRLRPTRAQVGAQHALHRLAEAADLVALHAEALHHLDPGDRLGQPAGHQRHVLL